MALLVNHVPHMANTTAMKKESISAIITFLEPTLEWQLSNILVYIDASAHGVPTGSDFSVPGYANNEYNVIILCFWLTSAVYDIAFSWMQLPVQTQRGYLEAYHAAGKVVLVSAFGSTEFPTTGGVDATRSANAIADFVVKNGLDGVDVDYEDNTAMDAGTGEEWVITYTRVLRERLPRPYIISHAPQAPYFIKDERYYRGGGYLRVNREVGDLIDFYNVQFYNQGNTRYDTCETLFYASGNVFPGTSVFEITANGVELGKIVVGKPITRAGVVNSGFMEASDMARCFADARGKGWNAGVMGWQYTLDPSFQWISALSSVL
ncbi:glycoside hydrolase family 18 protein [Obelidium mucronatum]|nr:glycoside hydrolase family 18 protein [Obelidium mucronatum]